MIRLRYEYTLTLGDYEALARITQQRTYSAALGEYWRTTLIYSVILSAAAYALILIEQFGIACLIGTIVALYFYSAFTFKHRFWTAISRSIVTPTEPVVLEISEDGLRELSDGIESFAPWNVVTRRIYSSDHTFLELASRLWAIVPHTTLTPESDSIKALREVVTRRTEQGAAANP